MVSAKSDLEPNQTPQRSREQFWEQGVSSKENEAWIKARWQAYQDKVVERLRTASELATGSGGDGTGWDGSSCSCVAV